MIYAVYVRVYRNHARCPNDLFILESYAMCLYVRCSLIESLFSFCLPIGKIPFYQIQDKILKDFSYLKFLNYLSKIPGDLNKISARYRVIFTSQQGQIKFEPRANVTRYSARYRSKNRKIFTLRLNFVIDLTL